MDKESKEIIVEIRAEDLITMHHFTTEGYIIKKLKDAGIPIIGILLFHGVSHGTLYQEENILNNSYIFRWKNS